MFPARVQSIDISVTIITSERFEECYIKSVSVWNPQFRVVISNQHFAVTLAKIIKTTSNL